MAKISRQDAKKLLANVPEEYVFRSYDGSMLRNMRDLAQSLASMTDETFTYHSNEEKKDFSNWVRDIIGDQTLAKALEKSLDRNSAAGEVSRRLAFLEGKLL